MCGIGGCIVPAGSSPDAVALGRMAAALAHRGPDDLGLRISENVGLVHRRLSIVDTSGAGHQPMSSADGRWQLTYNGEIFNHQEIRATIGNHRWRGHSDTETLIEALSRWDVAAISRCNGLFAYAALDVHRGRVLLVRDRFGVKPLYIANHDGVLWFSSEVVGLHAAGVPARARVDALRGAVAHGWVGGSITPFEGITRVRPGTVLTVDTHTGVTEERAWYTPPEMVDTERMSALSRLPRHQLEAELEGALRAAVHRRLMSDVPLGTMCSGGIDSSLIARFAADTLPGMRAYSAAIVDQPDVDESHWAERIATAIGFELRTIEVSAESWRRDLVDVVQHTEYPLIHESSVAMAQIAALARADGVKVLLSGEGADELFGGYDHRHRDSFAAFVPAGAVRREALEKLRGRAEAVGRRRGRGTLRILAAGLGPAMPDSLTHPAAVPEHRDEEQTFARRALDAYGHHSGARQRLEAGLMSDLQEYLPHLLNRQDKNTMQHSVETRVPFLDPEVVALALNLPLEARVMPRRKGILRDLAAHHLPRSIATRRKVGFGFDVRTYLDGAVNPTFLRDGYLRDLMGAPRTEWESGLRHLSWSHALRFWTGEIWCRLMLDGQSVEQVEADLWQSLDARTASVRPGRAAG